MKNGRSLTPCCRTSRAACRALMIGRVLNGIFFVLRTGIPWRDLPERYGPYTTVYNRYNCWAKAGVWARIFEALAQKMPQSLALIASSIIRGHQHSAGAKKGARKKRPLAVHSG